MVAILLGGNEAKRGVRQRDWVSVITVEGCTTVRWEIGED